MAVETTSYYATIALIGPPNAGKSTLLNRLVGSKLSIVTPKAQTTRTRVTGVLTEGAAQLVFMDVPGVFEATKTFEKAMVATAWQGAGQADMVLFLFDARKKPDDETEAALARLAAMAKPLLLAVNKVDAVEHKPVLLERIAWFKERVAWKDIFLISAKTGDGVDALQQALVQAAAPGTWLYPEDTLTDLPMRLIAAELTREQCFLSLQEELPYTLHVETESYEVRRDGSVEIRQAIIVQNERQKMIVIGAGGQMLKKIGERARKEIGKVAEATCHLYLFVKVRADWKEKPQEYLGQA